MLIIRPIRYFFACTFQRKVEWLLAPVMTKGLGACSEEGYGGIKLIEINEFGEPESGFAAITIAALRLVETVDLRRFRRIQRNIKFIQVDEGLRSDGAYLPAVRCCKIRYSRFKRIEYPEWDAWRYATLLVHEATHGAVHARWVPYTVALRARIEQLCHTEERRFARRSDNHERQWSDALVETFDERRWHRIWNETPLQRMKRWFARKRKSRVNTAGE